MITILWDCESSASYVSNCKLGKRPWRHQVTGGFCSSEYAKYQSDRQQRGGFRQSHLLVNALISQDVVATLGRYLKLLVKQRGFSSIHLKTHLCNFIAQQQYPSGLPFSLCRCAAAISPFCRATTSRSGFSSDA